MKKALLMLALLGRCGVGPGSDDGGAPDAGAADGGSVDAAVRDGAPRDAGKSVDAALDVRQPVDAQPVSDAMSVDSGRDAARDTGATAQEAGQPPIPICGDFVVEPGEGCDFPDTLPELCQSCQLTDCGNCFLETAFVPTAASLCAGLDEADTVACNRLVSCLAGGIGACISGTFGVLNCFCSSPDTSCSTGVNGRCASPYEALAHSSDPAVIIPLIGNRATPVGKISNDAVQFAGACGSVCSRQMN